MVAGGVLSWLVLCPIIMFFGGNLTESLAPGKSLGSAVDQIYPLGPRAVEAGGTVYAIGRLRGVAPREVTLRWRDAGPFSANEPVVRL